MLCNLEFVNSDKFVSHGRYVEKKPGQFVADTSCEKLPKELCGKGEAGKKLEKTCIVLCCITRSEYVGSRGMKWQIINGSKSTFQLKLFQLVGLFMMFFYDGCFDSRLDQQKILRWFEFGDELRFLVINIFIQLITLQN